MKLLNKLYQHALIDHHVEVEEEGGTLFSALTIIVFASIALICWFLL